MKREDEDVKEAKRRKMDSDSDGSDAEDDDDDSVRIIHLYSKTVVVFANLLLNIDAAYRLLSRIIYQNYKSPCTFISLAIHFWNVHSGMDINRFYRIHVTCETSIDISHVTSIRIPFPRFASVVRFIASKFVGMCWKVKSLRSQRK